MSKWRPIESAPKDKIILLWAGKHVGVYPARLRKGYFNEPSPDAMRWRDANGKFATPTHWMECPKPPCDNEVELPSLQSKLDKAIRQRDEAMAIIRESVCSYPIPMTDTQWARLHKERRRLENEIWEKQQIDNYTST